MAYIEFQKPLIRLINNNEVIFTGLYQEFNKMYLQGQSVYVASRFNTTLDKQPIKDLWRGTTYYFIYHPLLKFVAIDKEIKDVVKPLIVDGKYNL